MMAIWSWIAIVTIATAGATDGTPSKSTEPAADSARGDRVRKTLDAKAGVQLPATGTGRLADELIDEMIARALERDRARDRDASENPPASADVGEPTDGESVSASAAEGPWVSFLGAPEPKQPCVTLVDPDEAEALRARAEGTRSPVGESPRVPKPVEVPAESSPSASRADSLMNAMISGALRGAAEAAEPREEERAAPMQSQANEAAVPRVAGFATEQSEFLATTAMNGTDADQPEPKPRQARPGARRRTAPSDARTPRPVPGVERTPDEPVERLAPTTRPADEPPTTEPAPARPPGSLMIGEVQLSGDDIVLESVGTGLLIYGNPNDVALLQALIQQLDEDIPPRELRIITLEKKKAVEVAQGVQTILRDLWKPVGPERPQDQVTVSALSANIILIAAPGSKMDQIVTIIEQIDKVPPPLPPVEMMTFDIKHRKPSEAAEKLKPILDKLRQRVGAEAGPEFDIQAFDDTGKITVFGPVSERDKIQSILNEIDAEPRPGFGEIKLVLFPLLNNKATDMADTLNDLLSASETKEAAQEAIRRLKMIKRTPDGEEVELPPLDLEKPLKIIPDAGTESLIVATVDENIDPMGELIKLLDQVPLAVEMGIRIFPLRYADADSVADLLDEMFESGKDLPKPAPGSESTEAVPEGPVGAALVYNVGIASDLRTNTVIVSGRPEQVALCQMIVSELDKPSSAIKFPLRLIEVQNSSATRLGKVIQELFDKRLEAMESTEAGASAVERERVFITVDERTNALVVAASEENYAEILRIVDRLDGPPDRPFDHIRIINCKNTSAADLASKIEDLWERKAELRREAELPEDLPVIVADQRSNAMVIASSPEDFAEIKTLVDRLEAQELAPIAEIRLITLINNDATEVGDMLSQLFEERMQQRLAEGQDESPSDRVAIASDAATNTILVASSRENFEEMTRIIEAIDVEPDLEGVVRVFFLEHAVAADVSDRIQELFDQGLYHPQKGLESPLAEERQKIAVVDDPRSNAIVASASKTNLSIIEQLIQQMDSDEPLMLQAETRLFKLTFADVVKVADMLERMFEGIRSGASEPDLFPEPTVIPDDRSNTLIVTGTRDALKRTESLLRQIDLEGEGIATFEVYSLKSASAARLAPKIQEMFEQRQEGVEGERSPLYVQADEATNSLIATASPEDHALIAGLLQVLDRPSRISTQVEIFPLKEAKAEALAERLENLFQSQAEIGGGTQRADVLAVEPDPRTNSLIVWAAPSEMENIAAVIEKLDTTKPGPERMVKVFRLERARAEDFAEVLDNTLNPEGGGQDEQAVIIHFEDPNTGETRALVRQDITITPDAKTNSLMVMAPMGSMDMLSSLIRAYDRLPPHLAEIRLFPLVNADAEEVLDKLENVFEDAGGEDVEQQFVYGDTTRPVSLVPTRNGGIGSVRLPPRFAADRRTNTVIAAGHAVDLLMVEQLVRMLDIPDVEERITEVYMAQYSTSEDISAAVEQFMEQERDRLSDIEGDTAAMRRAERHVTVVGDETTNSVLIGVSPRYYSQVMSMVHQIDRPPPQVMIQVLIAEVTLNDEVGIGFEFAVQDLQFSENAVVGPNGTVSGADHDVVAGTDIGAASVGGALGGFSFTITGEDFNFLFKALQSEGKVEVLSRPTIMVENNEEANITIGNQVPIVQGVSVSDSGQLTSQVQYQDVGIILNVTPHINPDGFVNLEVAPEISSLSPSTVQISEGFTAPVISERSAETVVTIKDGETVVIGGLIDTSETETETKVPLVGDIPLLGALFRATDVRSSRTELLIVLTVDVIRNEDDAYAMSVKLRDQAGIIPEHVKQNPLMEGLRIVPEEENGGLGPIKERQEKRRQGPQDRPLYGPNPEVYGPDRPQRLQISQAAPSAIYGPALVSHEKEPE